jgi:hypothetical protein
VFQALDHERRSRVVARSAQKEIDFDRCVFDGAHIRGAILTAIRYAI